MKKTTALQITAVCIGLLFLSLFLTPHVSAEFGYRNWGRRELRVRPGETFEIRDEQFDIDGNIIVETGGSLIVVNAWINMLGKDHTITFDGSRLEVQNGTISTVSWDKRLNFIFQSDSQVNASGLNVKFGTLLFKDTSIADLSGFNYVASSPYPEAAIRVEGSAVLEISNSTVMEPPVRVFALSARGSAQVSLFNSIIFDLDAQGSSIVTLTRSGILWALSIVDSAQVTVAEYFPKWAVSKTPLATSGIAIKGTGDLSVDSMVIRKLNAYDYSTLAVNNVTIQDGTLYAYNSSSITMTEVTMAGSTVRPRVVAFNASTVDMINCELPSASTIGAYESSQIEIAHSTFGELAALNSSVVSVTNSTSAGIVHASASAVLSVTDSQLDVAKVYESSSFGLTNSEANLVEVYDNSRVAISTSNVMLLRASDSSTTALSESSVDELFLYMKSAHASVSALITKTYSDWNSSTHFTTEVDGYAPQVTLTNTEIEQGWSFWFYGTSNVTLSNSLIEVLWLSDSSLVTLINSTAKSAPSVIGQGTLYVYWLLDVYSHEGADVSVKFSNANPAGSGVADSNGWTRFTLLEKTVTGSGTESAGAYQVNAEWDGSSYEAAVEMSSNKSLTLGQQLAWWTQYWYVIAIVAAAVVLVAFLALRRRGKTKTNK